MKSIANLSRPLLQVLAPPAPARFTPWSDAVISFGRSIHGDNWGAAETAKASYEKADREALVSSRLAKEQPDLAKRNFERKTWEQQWRSRSPHEREAQAEQDAELGRLLSVEMTTARETISASLPSLDELKKQNEAKKARLAEAKAQLVDAVLNGRLQGYWLQKGSPSQPASLPIGQFMAALAGGDYQLKVMGMITHAMEAWHVYVDTDGLKRLAPVASDARDDASALGLEHLSPYMRLMIHVARQGKITADNQPKASSLEADIKAAAPLFGLSTGPGSDIIDRNLGTMAMFLREK